MVCISVIILQFHNGPLCVASMYCFVGTVKKYNLTQNSNIGLFWYYDKIVSDFEYG